VTTEDDRRALLELHDRERRAHLEGDAEMIASVFADEVWQAGRGQLRLESRAEVEQRFRAYFATVRYSVWDDLQPPHVWVSDDGRSGWMAVHIEGRLIASEGDSEREAAFESAWIATYEKLDGRWQMVGVSSSVIERD
jgi:uncharacterized protein (TIGR02246 family)